MLIRDKSVRRFGTRLLNLPCKTAGYVRKTLTKEHDTAIVNNVQDRGGEKLNTVITSKKAILETSRKLIQENGWAAISIRSVAQACKISVGSVYNYFDSKSDLIATTVESVWCDIFHIPDGRASFSRFTDCIEWAYESMRRGNEKYPGFFSMHSMSFVGEDKSSGQELMAKSWKHIQDGFYMVLMRDEKIDQGVFDDVFTPQKFVEIICSLIISSLLRHDYDCSGIVRMVERILYR